MSFTPDPRQVDLAGLGILVPLLPGLQECQAKLVPISPARSGQRKPSLVCSELYISEYQQKQSKGSVLFTPQRTDICPGCSGAMLWEGAPGVTQPPLLYHTSSQLAYGFCRRFAIREASILPIFGMPSETQAAEVSCPGLPGSDCENSSSSLQCSPVSGEPSPEVSVLL